MENSVKAVSAKETAEIKKRITFEEAMAKYDGQDKIISSFEAKKILEETPPNEYNFKSQIPALDNLLEGVETGELIVVSGPTGHGKTLLCQTLTRNFEKQNLKCLWFSYEIPIRQFISRFKELPLFYLPKILAGKDINWIERKIWESKLKYESNIIFIDHLGFLNDIERRKDVRHEIDSLVRKIKTLAIKHNILVFLLWHNKRPPQDRRNHELTEDDLKESSGIAQDSDIVLMIKREFEEQNGEKNYDVGKAKLSVIKSRRSGTMRKFLNLRLLNGFFEEEIQAVSAEIKTDEIEF